MKKAYYKGFNSELQCDPTGKKPFQYEVGKTYEEPEAILEKKGSHACENPLDVFNYYPPATSRFCEVELEDIADSNGTITVAKKITIKKELSLNEFIQAAAKFNLDKVDGENVHSTNTDNRSISTNTGDRSISTNTGSQSISTNTGEWSVATNTGYRSVATNTGYRSAATNTGYRSAATNTGEWSVATNTGYRSAATNTGYRSAATNTGEWSVATNTGDCSAATNTGEWSAATNTGDCSAATNTGHQSAATVEGTESVAISLGIGGKAKGAKGCYLVLAEWRENDIYEWHRTNVKSVLVDGEIIKADTFYQLKNGEFVEVE